MVAYRVIKSGHIIEIYEYEHMAGGADYELFDEDAKKGRDGGRDNEGIESRKSEYAATVNQRARNKIRRLINANFTGGDSLFVTLTFADNVQDVAYANKEFQKFIKKMNRRQENFKYLAVIEFQKRGAVHYHMLCNYQVAWENQKELQNHETELGEVWGHGFVDIGYKKTDNAGAYLIKYMTKDNSDERLKGKKRYFYSQNLIAPEVLQGMDALEIIKKYRETPAVFTNQYYSEFHGNVQYTEYNPLRYDLNTFNEIKTAEENAHVMAAIAMFGDIVEVFE